MKKSFTSTLLVLYLSLLALCIAHSAFAQTLKKQDWSAVKIEAKGGRVDWYKGKKHNLIAYDSITDLKLLNTDVFVMQPDGKRKVNITRKTLIPRGFIGQPAWHPDGAHLVLQAESSNSKHRFFNHMSWGINNDLWLVKKDGSDAQLIWSSPMNHASLHPHFNKDGTKIIFAERISTGKSRPFLRLLNLGNGGENQWDGWNIHLADFDISKSGKNMLSNHKILLPNKTGFYETHGFSSNGDIIYSFTPSGRLYVDDIYTCNKGGANVKKLIDSPTTWDEHGIFSPSFKSMAFISSRADKSWRAPESKAKSLRTEIYLKREGKIIQLTDFNIDGQSEKRFLVSDFDWNAAGNKIVFQVVPVKGKHILSPELWMLTFQKPQ